MKRATPLLLLALLGACDDGPSGPEPVRNINIVLNSLPIAEESLLVGETLELDAVLSDAAGRSLLNRSVRWQSSAPAVATVDSTGLVSGAAPGTARIVATAELGRGYRARHGERPGGASRRDRLRARRGRLSPWTWARW